jgi:hypothetical protein
MEYLFQSLVAAAIRRRNGRPDRLMGESLYIHPKDLDAGTKLGQSIGVAPIGRDVSC